MIIAYQGKKFHGFTLFELLITLAIMGILFSLAIPSFSRTLLHNQQTSVLHNFFSQLNYARTEAIKTNHPALLCKSINGRQCIKSGHWSAGWIIFSDKNLNKQVDNNEPVLLVQQALAKTIYFDYKGAGSSHYFQYFPDGRGSSNGTFTLCHHADQTIARSIIVSRTGRARIDNKTGSGKALSCS